MSKRKKQQYVQTAPKKQGGSFLFNFILFLGFVFAVSAVGIFISGYSNFQTQWDQTEWTVATAQAMEVTDSQVNGITVYEVEYQYEAGDTTYTGTAQRTSNDLKAGDSLTIKYNPDSPDASTADLTVDMAFIIQASISAVLAVIFLYGPSLYKKKKEGGPVRRLPLR